MKAQSEDLLSLKYRGGGGYRSSYRGSSYKGYGGYNSYGGYGGSVIIIGGGYYSPSYGYYSSDTRCANMTCEFCCFEGVCRNDAYCKEMNSMSAGAVIAIIFILTFCVCVCCLGICGKMKRGQWQEMNHGSHNSSFSSNGGHKHHHHQEHPLEFGAPNFNLAPFPGQEPLLLNQNQPDAYGQTGYPPQGGYPPYQQP